MLLDDCYISFINLDHRKDRLTHMRNELYRVGIEAERTKGIMPDVFNKNKRVEVMRKRTPGAIGCHYSQVSIIEKALKLNKHAFVMEDDLIFCSDIKERLIHIGEFTNTHDWDVIWLGGTFHVNPPYWHQKGHSRGAPNASANLGYDAKCTDDQRMIRTFGAFSTFAYIVNKHSIEKILRLLDSGVPDSIGIDWLFIKLQPQLNCFAYVPGCVKQIDNQSDIGKGITMFSGFSRLNGSEEKSRYWFQDKLTDFNPSTFNWAEAK